MSHLTKYQENRNFAQFAASRVVLLYEFNATLWISNINCINIKILSSSKNKSHMKKQIPSNYREFIDALYNASNA